MCLSGKLDNQAKAQIGGDLGIGGTVNLNPIQGIGDILGHF